MKTRLLVAILGLLFSQGVFAGVFPYNPTAKQLYELIDEGKVLGTHASGSTNATSVTIVLHPKYGLVTCFGVLFTDYVTCVSAEK
jgi:hypothetical protein